MEMVEGKDRPQELGPAEFDVKGGKTSGLLLRMLKSVFHTGCCVALDSGFCVLKALIALKKKGVFAAALIKNAGFGRPMSQASTFLNISKRRQLELLMPSLESSIKSNTPFGV